MFQEFYGPEFVHNRDKPVTPLTMSGNYKVFYCNLQQFPLFIQVFYGIVLPANSGLFLVVDLTVDTRRSVSYVSTL